MRDCRMFLSFSSVGLLCACSGGGADQLEIFIQLEGDQLMIDWEDGRAVHSVTVVPRTGSDAGSIVWQVSVFEGSSIPDTAPTILPPLRYGQPVDPAFTVAGPRELFNAVSYEVIIDEFGWGERCEEIGIPVATADTQCSLGTGRTQFSL